jgi:hypothetical protein
VDENEGHPVVIQPNIGQNLEGGNLFGGNLNCIGSIKGKVKFKDKVIFQNGLMDWINRKHSFKIKENIMMEEDMLSDERKPEDNCLDFVQDFWYDDTKLFTKNLSGYSTQLQHFKNSLWLQLGEVGNNQGQCVFVDNNEGHPIMLRIGVRRCSDGEVLEGCNLKYCKFKFKRERLKKGERGRKYDSCTTDKINSGKMKFWLTIKHVNNDDYLGSYTIEFCEGSHKVKLLMDLGLFESLRRLLNEIGRRWLNEYYEKMYGVERNRLTVCWTKYFRYQMRHLLHGWTR